MAGWISPEQYVRTVENATVTGGLLFTNFAGWPMQLLTAEKPAEWQLPGDDVECGEDPWTGALRGCEDKTGHTFVGPQQLLLTHFCRRKIDEWPVARVGFVFNGGALPDHRIDAFELDPEVHQKVEVLPMDDWRQIMPTQAFRRLEAAYTARMTGAMSFLSE